jgi:hypothetical protein
MCRARARLAMSDSLHDVEADRNKEDGKYRSG